MMTRRLRLFLATIGIVSAVVLLNYWPDSNSARTLAAQRGEAKEHVDADHEKRSEALRKAMTGPVDIYIDITQIEGDKPMIRNAKYVDLVDVTGKDLLRFTDVKGQDWLIDPDTVLTFCIKSKQK